MLKSCPTSTVGGTVRWPTQARSVGSCPPSSLRAAICVHSAHAPYAFRLALSGWLCADEQLYQSSPSVWESCHSVAQLPSNGPPTDS